MSVFVSLLPLATSTSFKWGCSSSWRIGERKSTSMAWTMMTTTTTATTTRGLRLLARSLVRASTRARRWWREQGRTREALRAVVASRPCARELRTAGSQRAPPHNHDYNLGHGHVEDRDTHASAQASEQTDEGGNEHDDHERWYLLSSLSLL